MSMTAQSYLLYVEVCLLLPINVIGQYVGTLSLHSSLESNNRKYACPQESVALTCSINGTVLIWEVQEGGNNMIVQVRNFRSLTDSVGSGFSKLINFSGCGEITFSGVLEYISGENISICNSSMTITPSSRSWNILTQCDPLTIFCKTPGADASAAPMKVTYKVAGQPNALDRNNSTCVYHKFSLGKFQYCFITTLIDVTDMLMSNKATEVSYVSIRVLNPSEQEQPHNFSISPTTNIGILNATFHYSCLADKQISVSTIIVDKCAQESLSEIIHCMTLESKAAEQNSTNKSNNQDITGILVSVLVLAIIIIISLWAIGIIIFLYLRCIKKMISRAQDRGEDINQNN